MAGHCTDGNFAGHCHRAAVLRTSAQWKPSLDGKIDECLKEAVDVLETPRVNLSGEAAPERLRL